MGKPSSSWEVHLHPVPPPPAYATGWQHYSLFGGGLPYLGMVKNPPVRITTKIMSPLSSVKSNLASKFQTNPSVTLCVILLTNQQTDK